MARRGHFPLAERVPVADNADETIAEQRLHTNFGTGCLPNDAGFQIHLPLAQWRAVFVGFLHNSQPHARRLSGNAIQQSCSEILHEALGCPQREGADKLFKIEHFGRPEHRLGTLRELSLSRFLGLITGATAMGAVFAFSSGFVSAVNDHPTAGPAAVATGMRISFAVAAVLIGIAIGIAVSSLALGAARSRPGDVS